MLSSKEIKNCPRDDHPRRENLGTQPLNHQKIFNEPKVLTAGWYPIAKSKSLKKKTCRSYTILNQRIVIFRGEDGIVRALDSFCPHMGADLGNGEVVGNKLQCFFHQWQFDENGNLTNIECIKNSEKIINSYPAQEKYGFIWVFSKSIADHEVPNPPGLKGDVNAIHFKKVRLFAHHHVMMTNGIDLAHFKAVHNLDIKFDFNVLEHEKGVFEWDLEGSIPRDTLFLKFASYLLGGKFKYKVLFAGGTLTSITYGFDARFKGTGFKLPSINIFWGATPTKEGVSEVDIFFVIPESKGIFSPFKKVFLYLFTMLVLTLLKDDDIKAFPHMRYNIGRLTPEDNSIAKLVQLTNNLEISPWTKP